MQRPALTLTISTVLCLAGLSASHAARAQLAADAQGGGPAAAMSTILSRPLFAPDRRPDPAETPLATQGGPAAAPRLTGILVDGANRRAIFAAPAQPGGTQSVAEGGQVGAYRVQTISLAAVTISGPGGVQTLAPRFANGLATVPAAPFSLPGYGVQAPALKLGPERFAAPVGPMGLAMYRYSPAAPHAPTPVPDALVTP